MVMTKERLQIKAFHIKNVALGRKVKQCRKMGVTGAALLGREGSLRKGVDT